MIEIDPAESISEQIRSNWERYDESAATARLAHKFNFSVVRLGNPSGDRETEPASALCARARLVDSVKALEDPAGGFGWYPDAGIRYDNLDGCRFAHKLH